MVASYGLAKTATLTVLEHIVNETFSAMWRMRPVAPSQRSTSSASCAERKSTSERLPPGSAATATMRSEEGGGGRKAVVRRRCGWG